MAGQSCGLSPPSSIARSTNASVSSGPSPSSLRSRAGPAGSCRNRLHFSAASIAAASASPTASTLTMSRASASSGKLPLAASAITLDVACASISSVWLSSSTAKRAGTLASNGTRCSSRSQKAWMVSIFNPPGVSTARANSVRASFTWARVGFAPSSSVNSLTRLSSSSVTQRPRRSNTRIAMLAAAALVKVRHRIRPGREPASSRRTTRSVSTLVFPAPALADTQAEARGLAARRCASLV